MIYPNIICIMFDDLDLCDLGAFCAWADDTDTPNIDALAAGGLVFSQFYSAASVCSPARISMLTGMFPQSFGYETAITGTGINDFDGPDTTQDRVDKRGIPPPIATIPELLQSVGYTTAHFGKWHVGSFRGSFRPGSVGFDQWVVAGSNWHSYTDFELNVLNITEDYHDGSAYQPVVLTDKVVDFIGVTNEPFYINFWPMLPHYPPHVPPGYQNVNSYNLATDRGMIQAMIDVADQQIGRIVTALDVAGKSDNTLIIVTSDHGGWQPGTQRPARTMNGYKMSMAEGGIRAPLIVYWPGYIAPGVDDRVSHFVDLLPTIANAAGADPVETIGYDLLGPEPPERSLIWEFQWSYSEPDDPLNWAIRKGDWKYISSPREPGLTGLYNLGADPNETTPVTDRPDLEASLSVEYYQMRREASRIPLTVVNGVTSYDDRLNFHVGNQTVILDAIIRAGQADMLAYRGTIWSVSVDAGGILSLTMRGEEPPSGSKTVVLMASEALAPGYHRVGFIVVGYKRSRASVSLVADGQILAYLNDADSLQAVASDISSGIVLAADVVGVEAYTVGLSADEFGR